MGATGQALPPGSAAKDTLDNRVVPIVFVPGVMGSRLRITGLGPNWDPNNLPEMGTWVTRTRRSMVDYIRATRAATLMRDLNGNILAGSIPFRDISARPRVVEMAFDTLDRKPGRDQSMVPLTLFQQRGWGEVVWSFYGVILLDLAEKLNPGSHGGELRPVYACGYDWRQTNRVSARTLAARVDQALKEHPLAKKVIIVSHSMGGLVTRAALALAGLDPKVVGVVHTVMPADGAVVAYRRFLTGAREELGETERGLRLILGTTPLEYTVMQSVLPGPVELLPSDSYPDAFLKFGQGITNKFFPDIFDTYKQQDPPGVTFRAGETEESNTPDLVIEAGDVTNLRAGLDGARSLTRAIAARAHANTFILFGNQRRTDVGFDWNRGTFSRNGALMAPMVEQQVDGDGTVPSASARFDGCTPSPIQKDAFGVEHAACFGDTAFRDATVERVQRLLALP